MGVPRRIQDEYERHCVVINHTDWPRHEKERIKKRTLQILKRDGRVDYRAFTDGYRWNLCSARLLAGDFTDWDGWQFRSPWFQNFMGTNGEKCPIPRWDYKPVKHLVVMGEQGLGDEILFLSALPDLLVRIGKGVEWVGYENLNSIVSRSFGIQTSGRRLLGEVTHGDAVMASGDLFKWYRNDVSHFPRKPFLKPDPERVERWSKWLKRFGHRPKIGLGWYSRHGFIDPKDLIGKGVYFDLQYRKEGQNLETPEGVEMCPFDFSKDFEDLFAFVKALDKVVSVTQTLVHIAGSVGTECHAITPPKNGEVTWYLWYNSCNVLGNIRVWPHLVYGSVKVYSDIGSYERNRLS